MPRRNTPIINGEFYHIYNRGSSNISMFNSVDERKRSFELINFYRFKDRTVCYSQYRKLDKPRRSEIKTLREKQDSELVGITALALMPNHFHFN